MSVQLDTVLFFIIKQTTAYEMRMSDWSSDVCSSDLTAEVAPQTPSAARSPNIGVTSAPGVAFIYAYAFRLDDSRIAAVQEEHAAACEALGTTRCRITGMTYRLIRENEEIGRAHV